MEDWWTVSAVKAEMFLLGSTGKKLKYTFMHCEVTF